MTVEENTTSATPPKRRWFRYSMRTLLLVTTALCIWLGFKVEAARKQREAVAAIKKVGGYVDYDYDKKPHHLANYCGVDLLHSVISVRVFSKPDSPQELRELLPHLSHLPRLRKLSIINGRFRDVDLQHIAGLTELKSLELYSNAITGEGFKHLVGLKQLLEFECYSNPISDESIKPLAELKHLEWVYLGKTDLTDDCVATLTKMSELKHLFLETTGITWAGEQQLRSQLPNTKIDHPRITF
jgi:hypothetical protein